MFHGEGECPPRFSRTFGTERGPPKGGRYGQKRLFSMPRRKKRKFSAAKEAKRQARVRIGSPPAERVLPDKRKKAPKHKKTFDLDEF